MSDAGNQGLGPCYEPYPNRDGTVSYTRRDTEETQIKYEERRWQSDEAPIEHDYAEEFLNCIAGFFGIK